MTIAKRKNRIYKADTLGGSKCHATLSDLLNRSPQSMARRVARRLQDYHAGLLAISTIQPKGIRLAIAGLWRDRYVKPMEQVTPLVESYFRACVVLGYRKLVRESPLNHRQRANSKPRWPSMLGGPELSAADIKLLTPNRKTE